MVIPAAPGTPGPKPTGGGNGTPPGGGPDMSMSKLTGTAGCPVSKSGEVPPLRGAHAVLSEAISYWEAEAN